MEKIKLSDFKKQIHPDLKNLIIQKKDLLSNQKFKRYGMDFELTKDEPSALPEEFTVECVEEFDDVIPLQGYSFAFDELNPEQKYLYTQFLCDPYSGVVSVEYVYLFYCGLERLLFTCDVNKVTDMIIKLRNIYGEKSTFRNYSAKMLLYISAVTNNKKLYTQTLESINLEEEIRYIHNYYFFAKYKFNIPFDAKEFMLLAGKFGFKNKLYLNKYPEIFKECLECAILKKYKNGYVPISKCINKSSEKSNNNLFVFSPFANSSLLCAEIKTEISNEGQKTVYSLLQEAHDMTKVKLGKMRKGGDVPKPHNLPKMKKSTAPAFSEKAFAKMEQELMMVFEKSVDAEEKYNKCCDLCKHYFIYRKNNESYSEKCLKYSEICLSLIQDVLHEYNTKKEQEYSDLKEKYNRYDKSNDYFMMNIVQNSIGRLEEKYSFSKKIDAFVYIFTILAEQEKLSECISICNHAIKYYSDIKTKNHIGLMIILQQIEYFKNEKVKIEEHIQ